MAASYPLSASIDVTTGRGMDTNPASGEGRSTLDRFGCATISQAIMKAVLSMALVLAVCRLAGGAYDKVIDPVGTWQCSDEIGEKKRTSTPAVKNAIVASRYVLYHIK